MTARGPTLPLRAVLFDLDGTLTDPREGFVGSINYALTALGRTSASPETLLPFIGPPIHGTFQSLLGTDAPAPVEEAVSLYRERLGGEGIAGNAAYSGVAEMLTRLKAAGKALFVATAKPLVFAVPILEHCGLSGYFTGVYGSDLGRTNTPKGELIRAILRDHGITAGSALMVGDRRHDIEGARESGVYALGVTYGYGSVAELKEAGADALCDSPEDVARIVLALGECL